MEHFIKNIEITNFKSIRHAEVKDCRRVNVFVGYPNVGKSNILEGLSLFSIIKDLNLVKFKDLVRVTKNPTIFFNGKVKIPFSITLNDEYKIVGNYRNEDFDLSAINLKHMEFVQISEYEEPTEIPLQYNNITFRNFEYLQSAVTNYNPHMDGYFPYPKKYEFQKEIAAKLGDFSILSYPFGENLFSIIQSNSEIRKELGSLLKPYNLKMLFDSSYQSFSLLKTIDEENVFSVDYRLTADTLQRLFFFKTAILSNKEQTLLLEEPEAHMFPPYISKMTGDIIYDQNNNQFFIATHSPYVLGDLIRDVELEELSVYIVDYDAAKGETLIHRMNDEEVNEAYQFGHDFFMNINNFISKEQHEQV